eukprot:1260983-Pyramimonas_sp.AAC.1
MLHLRHLLPILRARHVGLEVLQWGGRPDSLNPRASLPSQADYGNGVDVRGDGVDVRGDDVDVKGYGVDVRGDGWMLGAMVWMLGAMALPVRPTTDTRGSIVLLMETARRIRHNHYSRMDTRT